MKNALHSPVIVLAIFCLHLSAPAQSDSDAAYVDTQPSAAILETPRSALPDQPGLADACGYNIAIRMIGTAGRYCQRMGWAEKFIRYQWEYHVVQGDERNCFALPDGRIAVFEGLARSVDRADQLAYVVGHAIGHVLSGHQPRNRKQDLPSRSPFSARAWAGMENFERLALGIDPAYRDADEQEADRISLTLMRLAGFDLKESLVLWDTMKQPTGQNSALPSAKMKALESRKKTLHALIAEITAHFEPLLLEGDTTLIADIGPCLDPSEKPAPAASLPPAQPAPTHGIFIFVLVDVLPSAAVQPEKIAPLQELGPVYLDEIMLDGLRYTRILLGDCADLTQAQQKQTILAKMGFPKTVAVEYVEGKRIRTLY
jgi:hypothetical protein